MRKKRARLRRLGAALVAVTAGGLVLVSGKPAPAASQASVASVTAGVVTLTYGDSSLGALGGSSSTSTVPLSGYAGDAALSRDGHWLAVTVGTNAPEGVPGVIGDVMIVDVATNQVTARTNFGNAFLSAVAINPSGSQVAFVRNLFELWVLDVGPMTSRNLTPYRLVAPWRGGSLFDPAFSPDGSSLYVAVVSDAWDGQDDRADDLYRIGMDGSATRVLGLAPGAQPDDWTTFRRPQVDAANEILVTRQQYVNGSLLSDVMMFDAFGNWTRLGPVPDDTVLVGVGATELLFLQRSPSSGVGDLVSMRMTSIGGLSWDAWCGIPLQCTTLKRGLDDVALSAISGDGGVTQVTG